MSVIFSDDFIDEEEDDFGEFQYPEEVMPDQETLEQVEEIKAEGCLSRTSKFIDMLFKVTSILCVCSMMYIHSFYAPHSRNMNMDNLFESNAVIISDASARSICADIEEAFDIEVDEENDNYLLLNAVMCNKNLTFEEKTFCCEYIKLFNDNQYLDKERVYHSLLNVDISYKNRPHIYEDNVEGVYIDAYKSIGIFGKDEENNTLAHELIHCICANDGNLPTFFIEGVTELLANEYFSDSPFIEFNNYTFEIYAVKMLCDAAGSDVVLEAFTKGDMTPVYESLASYYGSVDDAKKAISIFDDLFLNLTGDKKESLYSSDELSNDLFLYLHEVVISRYGEDPERKCFDRSSFFYNEIMLLNVMQEEPMVALIENLEEFGVFCKPYFSSELKEIYNEPMVTQFEDVKVINEFNAQKVKKY